MTSNECAADNPWVLDEELYPSINEHVNVNGHTGYVRAIHLKNNTIDWEGIQYYKTGSGGASEPCYMDVLASGLTYPDDCLDDANGGGLIASHGRSSAINIDRTDISPLNAAIWCPERKVKVSDTMSGGGMFGPQYAYTGHKHSDTYTGQFPYTEFIEVAVDEPVYIFRIIIGVSRGAGGITSILAKDPSATPGSENEWMRLLERTRSTHHHIGPAHP